MAELNRSDLTTLYKALIEEGQASEEITPEDHNKVNDAIRDSMLNRLDDLSADSDWSTLVAAAKKYANPFYVMKYALAKAAKALVADITAGTNDTKYITPKGLADAGIVPGGGGGTQDLEEVLTEGNDAGGIEIQNVGAPTGDTSADTQGARNTAITSAITALKGGVPSGGDTLNKLYNLIVGIGQLVGGHDATTGLPTTGTGASGAIDKGDYWKVTVASDSNPLGKLKVGDTIFASIAGAAVAGDFFVLESNQDLATSSVMGLVKLYTSEGSNVDGTIDQNTITNLLAALAASKISKWLVACVSTTNLTVSAITPATVIDGVTIGANWFFLAGQTVKNENGIYTTNPASPPTKVSFTDTDIWNLFIIVTGGTDNAGTLWYLKSLGYDGPPDPDYTFDKIGGSGTAFNPTTAQIGDITATNAAIADNDTVTVAMGKAQGQINALIDGSSTSVTATGTNTYTATFAPTPVLGTTVKVKIPNTSTGPSTFNGKKIFVDLINQVGAGRLIAGTIYTFIYDPTLDSGTGGWATNKNENRPSLVTYSATLNFDQFWTKSTVTQSGIINFGLGLSPVNDSFHTLIITGDSASAVNFPAGWVNGNGRLYDNSKISEITFKYSAGYVVYAITPLATIPDTTAPVFSNVTIGDGVISSTSNNFSAQINEAGTIYYAVYPAADAAHTKAEIIAGTGAVFAGSRATAANVLQVMALSPLVAATDYKVHYFGRDSVSNDSAVTLTDSFRTLQTLFVDSFSTASVDLAKWAVTDPVDGVTISQVASKLRLAANPASPVTGVDVNYLASIPSFTTPVRVFRVDVNRSGDSVNQLGSIRVYNDTDPYATARRAEITKNTSGFVVIRVFDGSTNVYNVTTATTWPLGGQALRIVVARNNLITFQQFTGSWITMGSYSYALGSSLKSSIGANSSGSDSGSPYIEVDVLAVYDGESAS
jgi:hypothetical protein